MYLHKDNKKCTLYVATDLLDTFQCLPVWKTEGVLFYMGETAVHIDSLFSHTLLCPQRTILFHREFDHLNIMQNIIG